MTELTLSEAASRLGVSVDTSRRRLKSGELAGRQVGRKTMVSLPETVSQERRAASGVGQEELLSELRAERDRLGRLLDTALRQLDEAAAERGELRRLLEAMLDAERGARDR